MNPARGYEPVPLTYELVRTIHNEGGSILGTSRGAEEVPVMVDRLVELGVDILFCIGGDGTLRGAHALYEEIERRDLDIAIVGIPKTIDNDITFVYKTFGFDTAVEVVRSGHRRRARGSHRLGERRGAGEGDGARLGLHRRLRQPGQHAGQLLPGSRSSVRPRRRGRVPGLPGEAAAAPRTRGDRGGRGCRPAVLPRSSRGNRTPPATSCRATSASSCARRSPAFSADAATCSR